MTEQELDDLRARIRVVPREEHDVSRKNISDKALKVLYRLKDAGFEAYMVGGGVRDLSLGREPKDFDVVTDARPEDVKALFRNCRLIGRRFRLAHVHFGREIIEVATFRALHDPESEPVEGDVEIEDGRILRDNVYGSVEEDAFRRDFTINSLYYNIADFSVVDFANGMDDLRAGRVRLIGDPETRYREDPVRMLRAARFAAKLGFRIDEATGAPIPAMASQLDHIPQARLFDEVMKLFMGGVAAETFAILRHYGLFEHLFPQTESALTGPGGEVWDTFILRALENTDRRVNEGKPVTPAFLFAALLWPRASERATASAEERGITFPQALQEAVEQTVAQQLERVAIPKRFSLPMREIMLLQPRLQRFQGKRARRLAAHPRFRAAYDFLLLRAAAGDAPQELADWWTRFQEGQEQPAAADTGDRPAPARKRRRRRRRRGSAAPETPE